MYNFQPIIVLLLLLDSSFSIFNPQIHYQLHAGRPKRQHKATKAVPCSLPQKSKNIKSLFITDSSTGQPVDAQLESQVPSGSYMTITCNEGYQFDNGLEENGFACTIGKWTPAIKPCQRVCPTLQPQNVELKCKRNGREIDCNGALLSDTEVFPTCSQLHHTSPDYVLDYSSIRCRNDGTWSHTLYTCIPDCGVPRHQTLISGGTDAKLGQFPWHAAIYSIPRDYTLICGGTLITTNIVLSAGHCFYDEAAGNPRDDPNDYRIVLGKITRDYHKVDNDLQTEFEISSILFNEDKPYNPKRTGYSSDIAILILKRSVTINQYVLPACFRVTDPTGFKPREDDVKGALAGWGVDENGVPAKELKTTLLPYVNYQECAKKIVGVTVDKFCAGGNRGPKPGRGDSGGGLVFKDPNNNHYYIRGIVSTDDRFSASSVTTFTDISYYKEWIDRIVREKSERAGGTKSGYQSTRTTSYYSETTTLIETRRTTPKTSSRTTTRTISSTGRPVVQSAPRAGSKVDAGCTRVRRQYDSRMKWTCEKNSCHDKSSVSTFNGTNILCDVNDSSKICCAKAPPSTTTTRTRATNTNSDIDTDCKRIRRNHNSLVTWTCEASYCTDEKAQYVFNKKKIFCDAEDDTKICCAVFPENESTSNSQHEINSSIDQESRPPTQNTQWMETGFNSRPKIVQSNNQQLRPSPVQGTAWSSTWSYQSPTVVYQS